MARRWRQHLEVPPAHPAQPTCQRLADSTTGTSTSTPTSPTSRASIEAAWALPRCATSRRGVLPPGGHRRHRKVAWAPGAQAGHVEDEDRVPAAEDGDAGQARHRVQGARGPQDHLLLAQQPVHRQRHAPIIAVHHHERRGSSPPREAGSPSNPGQVLHWHHRRGEVQHRLALGDRQALAQPLHHPDTLVMGSL